MSEAGTDRGIGILTTRIGRRFVLMFLGCAFVPLALFALMTLVHVSSQLNRQNETYLHDAAKTAGMGLAARLSQLAGDFDQLRGLVKRLENEDIAVIRSSADALGKRYANITLLTDGRGVQLLGGQALTAPSFTAMEQQHLAAEKVLLHGLDKPDRLAVFAKSAVGRVDSPLLIAELRRDWLWDADELRGRGAEVVVFDGRRQMLFSSLTQAPETGPLFDAVGRSPSSGSVSWQVGAETHLARYWRAFLQPQYGIDLLIVQTRDRDAAMAAISGFETWFLLTAAGALLCVLLASLIQMRRTLGPIIALGAATRRVGEGDFAARVSIASRDEFGDLGVAFNRMTTQLAENVRRREQTERDLLVSRDEALAAVRAKAEFVTNVSHELRTPMAEILGATEILITHGGDEPEVQEEFIDIAFQAAKRLSDLLDDVLDLDSNAAWSPEPTDVRATLTTAIAGLASGHAARVKLQLDPDLPSALALPTRLIDAWVRLLDNAVKFSAADAPIEVRATQRGDEIVVEIEDHGVGIAAADLERVFEPFCQVGRDQLTNKASGTGLGLTIARNTVRRLGGRIELASELGRGSVFRVCLRVAAAPVSGAGGSLRSSL